MNAQAVEFNANPLTPCVHRVKIPASGVHAPVVASRVPVTPGNATNKLFVADNHSTSFCDNLRIG